MNQLIQRTRIFSLLCLAAIGAAITLANPTLSFAAGNEHHQHQNLEQKHDNQPQQRQIKDLRPVMDHMALKEGNNVVYSEGGVKLFAQVKGGQVAGYSAIGSNGKRLPTTIQRDSSGNSVVNVTKADGTITTARVVRIGNRRTVQPSSGGPAGGFHP